MLEAAISAATATKDTYYRLICIYLYALYMHIFESVANVLSKNMSIAIYIYLYRNIFLEKAKLLASMVVVHNQCRNIWLKKNYYGFGTLKVPLAIQQWKPVTHARQK